MSSRATSSRSRRSRRAVGNETYSGVADIYGEKWTWDKVVRGTHCIDCYPAGNCPVRVYVKDGIVVREEQSGHMEQVEAGVPDMNPMGCQKGAAWSEQLYSADRILHPLKRVGERGSASWKRISWEEALTEIADKLIDVLVEEGPEAILRDGTPHFSAISYPQRLLDRLGAITLDMDGSVNDFGPGVYITYGTGCPAASVDDWFHADLLLIWHMNPAYTRIPHFHYIAEARYKGAEVVSIAPDYNPSAVHADTFVAVEPGSDAALALSMCKVIIDEDIYDERFVCEQTDLPLLVRLDTRCFLRASDLEHGGSDELFYRYDAEEGVVAADRGNLLLGERRSLLQGRWPVRLHDGTEVEVTPVFELLRERLAAYEPELASEHCGAHPEVIRDLARKVAAKRTHLLMGFNSMKYYHGDLMERSIMLLLGLTGNWGKKGTGPKTWATGMMDGIGIALAKPRAGVEGSEMLITSQSAVIGKLAEEDATRTPELIGVEFETIGALGDEQNRFSMSGANSVPPAIYWYYHCGFRDAWNRPEWSDPSMKRSFDEYFQEATDKRWWGRLTDVASHTEPRVLIECGGNMLRRTRGGATRLLGSLWPKLDLIVVIDTRMSITALHSDIVLPAAHQHEKIWFGNPTPQFMSVTLGDRAVAPLGESRSEWDIFKALSEKLAERATVRGVESYGDALGVQRRLDTLGEEWTLGGTIPDEEAMVDEILRDCALVGTLPSDTTLETLREKGTIRFTGWGLSSMALSQASELLPDETHTPFRLHVEKGQPYPTLTRRAQFYVDHEWFLEAGEELPCHKDPPKSGGDYPFFITSGHNRWSVHSANMANPLLLNTHRGRPFAMLNPGDAEGLDIGDGDLMHLRNDFGELQVWAKIAPSVRPGQIILYNGWEHFMHPGWKGQSDAEPGMVKWLHLAGGYGHLRYRPFQWQPVPSDRGVRVAIRKVEEEEAAPEVV
jgi:DMSO reductase family type II enzyme molybdopterin subunit